MRIILVSTQIFILCFVLTFGTTPVWSQGEPNETSKKPYSEDEFIQGRHQILDQSLQAKDMVQFGDQLFQDEDYFNALTVYKYALFRTDNPKKAEGLRYRIALCYLNGKQWQQAENAFDDYISHHPKSKRTPEASYRIGQGYFRGKSFLEAINHFHDTLRTYPESDYAIRAQYASALAYTQLNQWELAKKEFVEISQEYPDHPLAIQAQQVLPLIDEGHELPRKSPILAGNLSLIPGLGKVYTKHYGGAIIAAIINGGLGFVVYDSFDNDRIAVGAIFSVLAAATYSANLIGSYRSAIRYNSNLEDEHSQKIVGQGYRPELELEGP